MCKKFKNNYQLQSRVFTSDQKSTIRDIETLSKTIFPVQTARVFEVVKLRCLKDVF